MKKVLLVLAMVLAGGSAAGATDHVWLMFSDRFNFEFQTRSLTFTVGKAFYRVRFQDTTYFIAQDSQGYRYASYRVQLQPRDSPAYVVFGVPPAYRRKGGTWYFSPNLTPDGQLLNPDVFRIVNFTGPSNAQMVPTEER